MPNVATNFENLKNNNKNIDINAQEKRVTSARPFINSGVDYAGPVWVHYKTRGKRPQKAYIAIFCCFATKAVHIELVSDLTTDAFIGALKRFIGRRGHCKNIYCDNATNFVGANNKLPELADTIYSQDGKEEIIQECNRKTIQFNFIPPRSPHFGGLWEAAVKSAKQLLLKSVSTESLTYEELETVLIEIEAILNSRPLTPMSDDPNDLTALTPGHFLIGEPLTSKIDHRATEEKRSLLSRWKLVSQLRQEFWDRWSREYLHELQHRRKWKQQISNIRLGELVIIKEDNLPPLNWPMGRIEKLYFGEDKAVRVVDVRTTSGVCKRPIHRLAPLAVDSESTDQMLPSQVGDREMTVKQVKRPSQNNQSTTSNDNPVSPKRTRLHTNIPFITLVITLFLLPLVLAEGVTVTPFTRKIGMHFDEIGKIKIVASQWKFIVYYDLMPLSSDLTLLSTGTHHLQQLCQEIELRNMCYDTVTHFMRLLNELQMDNSLLSIKRHKRGAIDLVGNVANSLFGVLDSKYAQTMSEIIAKVEENEDYLLQLSKNHTSIIDSTINIMKDSQETSKKNFEGIQSSINQIITRLNTVGQEERQVNLHHLFLSIASQLTLLVINIQRTQSALIDVLTDTHHGRINTQLLSPEQLRAELIVINSHIPADLEIPGYTESPLYLYKLMTVKGGITGYKAVFDISVPLVRQQQYTLFTMVPIPTVINNTMIAIKPCTDAIAINSHHDEFLTVDRHNLKSCNVIGDNQYLCFHFQTRFTKMSEICSCEIALFNNETRPTCTLEKYSTNSTWIQLSNPNQWLFSTSSPMRFTSVCQDKTSQVVIDQSGLITLDPGCSMRNNLMTLETGHVFSNTYKTSYISFGNISQISTPDNVGLLLPNIPNISINTLDHEVKRLTDLHTAMQNDITILPQKIQPRHHFVIGYGALAGTVLLALYLAWKSCKSAKSDQQLRPQPAPRQQQQIGTFNVNVDD